MSITKNEILNTLFKKYGLVFDPANPDSRDNDVFLHKHYKIITRQGIQKIEREAGITCVFTVVNSGKDFCFLSGVGTAKDGTTYQTLASASDINSTNVYFPEMAEKRCRSRIVLTLAGLYEQGVFGEDESDDFKQEPVIKTAVYKK